MVPSGWTASASTVAADFRFITEQFRLAGGHPKALSESANERTPRQHPGMERHRACGGAQEDRGGLLWVRARAWRDHRLSRAAFLRPRLFRPEGRGRQDRRRDLKGVFGRIRFKPEEGLEVIATGRLT